MISMADMLRAARAEAKSSSGSVQTIRQWATRQKELSEIALERANKILQLLDAMGPINEGILIDIMERSNKSPDETYAERKAAMGLCPECGGPRHDDDECGGEPQGLVQ